MSVELEGATPVDRLTRKLKHAPKWVIGSVEMSFDPSELDDYHIRKAERELRETEEVIQESLKILGDLLAGEATFSVV